MTACGTSGATARQARDEAGGLQPAGLGKGHIVKRTELDLACVNALRFLSVDMVERAASGHPGLPMGAAPMAGSLYLVGAALASEPWHQAHPRREDGRIVP